MGISENYALLVNSVSVGINLFTCDWNDMIMGLC